MAIHLGQKVEIYKVILDVAPRFRLSIPPLPLGFENAPINKKTNN